MSNLGLRVITAVVMLGALLALLFLAPVRLALIAFGGFMLIAAWEWAGFFTQSTPLRLVYVVVSAALGVLPWLQADVGQLTQSGLVVGALSWLLVVPALFLGLKGFPVPVTALAGLFALVPAWFGVLTILSSNAGPYAFLWCLGIVAAADIGAYFTGKSIGRRKLAPAISPGKTLEGMAGGLLCAGLVGAAAAQHLGRDMLPLVVTAVCMGAISVAGDLWVSRFKRVAGLKDSGKILPGHGGVLDRIDGHLAALPLFALFTTAVVA